MTSFVYLCVSENVGNRLEIFSSTSLSIDFHFLLEFNSNIKHRLQSEAGVFQVNSTNLIFLFFFLSTTITLRNFTVSRGFRNGRAVAVVVRINLSRTRCRSHDFLSFLLFRLFLVQSFSCRLLFFVWRCCTFTFFRFILAVLVVLIGRFLTLFCMGFRILGFLWILIFLLILVSVALR